MAIKKKKRIVKRRATPAAKKHKRTENSRQGNRTQPLPARHCSEEAEEEVKRHSKTPRKKPVFTRRNGGEFTAAQQLYEKFHGKASSQTITVVSSDRYRENLGALGQLQSLLILSAAMLEPVQLEFTSQHPVLCASPDGSSLYVEGGDQSVDTSRLGFSGANWKKDLMTLGALLEVTYRTKKDFHRFELIDYYHQLGEETGALPIVAYDALNKRIMLIGGQYDIRREGITN